MFLCSPQQVKNNKRHDEFCADSSSSYSEVTCDTSLLPTFLGRSRGHSNCNLKKSEEVTVMCSDKENWDIFKQQSSWPSGTIPNFGSRGCSPVSPHPAHSFCRQDLSSQLLSLSHRPLNSLKPMSGSQKAVLGWKWNKEYLHVSEHPAGHEKPVFTSGKHSP